GAAVAVSASGGTDLRDGLAWGLLTVLLVAAGVGLLPGVREIQVTAARALLGVNAPLVAETRDWAHRARSAVWTVLHAVTGLITGFCVLGLLPGAVVTFWALLEGRLDLLEPLGLGETWWSALLGGLAMLAATAAGPVLAALVAVRLAPRLLGPSAADRLVLAEQRLATERRHTALARELHDGIGHALSIIGIQAAAARRVAATRPDRAGSALHVIEQTARDAQAELDHLLGLLRDPQAPPGRAAREDLPTLLAKHRAAGLSVDLSEDHGPVPGLVWDAVLDILAEALTNAHRHGHRCEHAGRPGAAAPGGQHARCAGGPGRSGPRWPRRRRHAGAGRAARWHRECWDHCPGVAGGSDPARPRAREPSGRSRQHRT